MKYLIGLVFCALLGVGNAVFCDEDIDCEETECCVAIYCTQLLGLGTCAPLGRVGSPCNEANLGETYGKKFLSKCPCRENLDCTQTVTTGTRLQINAGLRCKRPGFFAKIFNKKTVGSLSVTKNKSN